jgi:DNA polymerase III alpha subunit
VTRHACPPFAELSVLSNFTFLTEASHPEEYMQCAALLGLPAVAIADENTVAGIVRAYSEAREIARQVAERQAQEAPENAGDAWLKQAQRLTNRLAEEGLKWRSPQGAPTRARTLLAHELALIAKLKNEPYFLTVRDIVAFAREQGIPCQGRGSAATSVVCYCLCVTSVTPEIGSMVFERVVSEAHDEPPDIDVDFEHKRR